MAIQGQWAITTAIIMGLVGLSFPPLARSQHLPNIVFFLTDDLGWNAPSFHNPDLITPTLQALHDEGVELYSHYTYRFCSPSRGSFLSGRFPFKLSGTRVNLNPASVKDGLHLSYTTIAEKMQQAGYATHQFGKWHLGFFEKEYTPLYRGFNSSYGFLTGGEDHFKEKTVTLNFGIDIWDTDQNAYGKNGTWSAQLYADAAVRVIQDNAKQRQQHGSAPPLFLYVALHDTHAPTEAPSRLMALYNHTGEDAALKNGFSAMVSAVDESVKNITDALKANNLWNNTLIVWTTDNGSPVEGNFTNSCRNIVGDTAQPGCICGSNYPLRGSKGNNFEGGVRTPTIVSGPYLPAAMRGKRLDGMVHICDWYATFCNITGVDSSDPRGIAPLDSINMWPYLSGAVQTSPRNFIVHDHLMFSTPTQGAIRQGKWKLIVQDEVPFADWFGPFAPNASHPTQKPVYASCPRSSPCLYDIEADMTEHHNLAASNPSVVQSMLAIFDSLEKEYHPPKANPPTDIDGIRAYANSHHNFLGPWVNV
eukprot:m.122869 g.122869  ORF g.122869 m.122869 type:complete len:533 (-) comp15556_c0_seq3:598-2196(-)